MGALVFRALMLTALYCKVSHVWAQQDKLTVQSAIEKLREKYAVMFVYNASLDLNIGYEGADLTGKNLQESLQMVFSGTDIKYEVRDGYVLLQKIKQYTLNGYVYQETGEAVVQGTVLDVNTGKGTLTDESGFFSLVLCEGRHKIRVSYIGTEEEVRDIDLKSDRMETVFLKSGYKLEESGGDSRCPFVFPYAPRRERIRAGKRFGTGCVFHEYTRCGQHLTQPVWSFLRGRSCVWNVCTWR